MSAARRLLSQLIPPAQKKLDFLEATRRQKVWGNTVVTLRVRSYPKSKDQRVSLVVPQWHKVRLWSEALRRKVELEMTNDTLRMIEGLGGLDSYLMKTPESQLRSDTASAVKWEVVTALRRREHMASLMSGKGTGTGAAAAPAVSSGEVTV
ncbi:50S ribosomal protein L28 [Tetrabaena socialis]|uniref:50S ribosomal protein L28 n=1 Tax=Tetrabaena socialis TaxID=47790 RepID=A0A2J7ZV47_9CHLO|nr:50S ribosomal protein L28 [Tetrabaena socialis]|eukprot:PNH04129.1 50S ribosomal protein L28 [Tetrabaena socialis]